MNKSFHRALLASSLLMGLPVAAQAQAQTSGATPAEPQSEITVTGSRLTNPNLEQAAPVTTVSAQEIALTGQVNVENIVNELPQLIPSVTAASNNPGGGVATADLRGLGATRTLVLVNGRRYVAYDSNQVVDLNTIPAALLEKVEVLTGGRSATYGSDAVSGVINFVTKQDFSGVQANANYRLTGAGDGGTFNSSLLVGKNFADGRGNITLYGDYTDRKGILQSARSYTATTLTDNGAGGFTAGGSGSIPAGRLSLGGKNYKFGTDGSYSPYSSPADLYNYASENYLQVPQERYMFSGQTHFDVSDHLTLYAEGQYIHNEVKNQLAPTPFTGAVVLDTNSSFLAPSTQALLKGFDTNGDGYVNANVYRRMTEVGDRISDMTSEAYRGLVGAKGQITGNWKYDAYFSYAETNQTELQYGNVSRQRVLQALKTTTDGSGNLVCSDPSNGCVPLNIFGVGNISSAAAKFVAITTTNASKITEKVASGVITNDNLFDLGAGPAGLVIGGEYRDEYGSYNPDAALASGDVVGFNAGQGLGGGYNVKELFTEVNVPLLADKPFVKTLVLNGAYRYSYYSTAAKSVNTYSGGLVWAPVSGFKLRGTYARAVRAPTVSDLYSGQSQGFPTVADPCTSTVAVSNANLRANCIATGVQANLLGTPYDGGNSQIESISGGNPNLREETADTYTLGAVFQPTFAPRFSLSVDYYHVKISNYISSMSTANLIKACYGDASNGWTPYNSSFCSMLPRDGTGTINGAINTLVNSGGLHTRGIDFEARYSVPLGFGIAEGSSRLDLRLSGTHLISFLYSPIPGLDALTIECAGKFGINCGDPYAKWRLSGRATWDAAPVKLSLAWRHLSAVKDDDDTTVYSVERIKAFDYFDLTASVDVARAFTWQIGVNNMFDRKPPLLGGNQQQSNTYPSTYDVYGRALFTGVTLKF